jgi:hypothetical protein
LGEGAGAEETGMGGERGGVGSFEDQVFGGVDDGAFFNIFQLMLSIMKALAISCGYIYFDIC